jgi:hypothetical protein
MLSIFLKLELSCSFLDHYHAVFFSVSRTRKCVKLPILPTTIPSRCNSFSGFYIYNIFVLHLQHVLHRASEASMFFLGSASAASGSLSDHTFKSIAPLIRLYMMKWYYRITACLPKSAVEMSAARCPIGSNSVSTLEYEIKILVLLRICSWCSWSSSFQHHSYRGVVERRDRAVLTLSELVPLHWQSWSRI